MPRKKATTPASPASPQKSQAIPPALPSPKKTVKVGTIKEQDLHFGFGPKIGEYASNEYVEELGRFLLFTLTSTVMSAIISTVTDPLSPTWSDRILKTMNWSHILVLALLRSLHSFITIQLRLSPFVSTAFLSYIRLPYYIFIFLFSDAPLPALLLSILNESVSEYLAALATFSHKTSILNTQYNQVFINNPRIMFALSIFSNLLLALPLHILSASNAIAAFAVRNFYPIPSLDRAYTLSLLQASLVLLPASAIAPYLISKPQGSHVPGGIVERAGVLAVLTALDAGVRLGASVGGATIAGAAGWAVAWALLTVWMGLGVRWVEQGCFPEGEPDQ